MVQGFGMLDQKDGVDDDYSGMAFPPQWYIKN
jgi:hypothetical protein